MGVGVRIVQLLTRICVSLELILLNEIHFENIL